MTRRLVYICNVQCAALKYACITKWSTELICFDSCTCFVRGENTVFLLRNHNHLMLSPPPSLRCSRLNLGLLSGQVHYSELPPRPTARSTITKIPETKIVIQSEGQESKTASHWLLSLPQSKMATLSPGISE